MNPHFYKEACMCRNPIPSRLIPQRCAWCGGILPPAVRALYQIERELDEVPTGGAIIGVLIAIILLAALVAMGRVTLLVSQHDPTPPTSLAQDIPMQRR